MTARVLLVTTNGAGMGHLARMSAVALAGRRTGSIEPIIMTLSVAAPLAAELGVPVEYCPSSARRWQSYWQWDAYFRDRLAALVEHADIDVVLFDGVMPYDGLLAVMAQFPNVRFVWCRRGFWRDDAKVARRALARSRYFDAVIEPSDLAGDDSGPTSALDAVRTAPVSLVSEVPPLSRSAARDALGIAQDSRCLFFAFGSGLSGDSKVLLQTVLRNATQTGWVVLATRPWNADQELAGVHYIDRVFPLVRYAHAFDAVVASAGYNAVHEYVSLGVPTLLVANTSLVTDDQSARAEGAARRGLALAATTAVALDEPLAVLLGGWQPSATSEDSAGAADIASALADIAHRPAIRQPNGLSRKLSFLNAFGPWLVGPVRRILGKSSTAIELNNVVFGDNLEALAGLAPTSAFEHIPALDSSGGYERARRNLAARAYPSRL